MQVFLPQASINDPWRKIVGAILFNWVAWYVSAVADMLDDYNSTDHQFIVSILVVFTFILGFGLSMLLGLYEVLSVLTCVGLGVGIYLVFGALYHLVNWRWGY